MMRLDEHSRPIVHIGPLDERNERERWVISLNSCGVPESLLQEYETPNATRSGASFVRPGKVISAEQFYTAEMPDEVRQKLYKCLEELNAEGA